MKKPRFKRRPNLTPKQVTKLAQMESYQIAKSHTFKELEFIVQNLGKIYTLLLKQKDAPQAPTKQSVNSNSSRNKKSGRKSRLSIRRGKSSKNKRGTMFGNARRASIVNRLAKGRQSIKRTAGDDSPISDEQLSKYLIFDVENALEKSDKARKTHQAFKEKEKQKWVSWETKQEETNTDALLEMKKFVPEMLKNMTEEQVAKLHGDNIYLGRRLVRHKVFQLLNLSFQELQVIHPADFDNKYHIGGLDIIEMRALYFHTTGLKRQWRSKLRKKLYSLVEKEEKGTLDEKEKRNPAYDKNNPLNTERRGSVFRKNSVFTEADDYVERQRATSLVADELMMKYGKSTGEKTTRNTRRGTISGRRQAPRRPSAVDDIFLVQKEPDAPVDTRTLRGKKKRNSTQTSRQKKNDSSDEDKKKRRPKNNIFGAFDEYTKGGSNQKNKLDEEHDADDEEEDDLIHHNGKRQSSLDLYFAQREKEGTEVEEPKKTGSKRPTRKESNFDFDESDYDVKDTDSEYDVKRKQSELFIKAFEMIHADDIDEDDEVFMKAIRKISTFSSTISEAEWLDRIGDFELSDAEDEKVIENSDFKGSYHVGKDSEDTLGTSSSSNDDDDPDAIANFYLRPASSVGSIPESAFTEDEFS